MVGRVIRKLGSLYYKHPVVQEDVVRPGKFGRLKIALVADHFTTECLSEECRIRSLTPANFWQVITEWKPDLVFVESAFHGADGTWRYELARQPRLLSLKRPKTIYRLVEYARDCGVPTVFWNKDDGAFFNTFIDVAKVFDYVFTTDSNCVQDYRQQVPAHVPVNTLAMPYQPAFHHFTGFHFSHNEACFIGSYYRRILSERKMFLDTVFAACADARLNLNVFDRNHHRLSRHFEFKFPRKDYLHIHAAVPHRNTARVYKEYAISINVNSVTNSETMCSRRLLEILACGGIAVTNPSLAVNQFFGDFCHVVATRDETRELLSRLRFGPAKEDLERAEAGANYVRSGHTWEHRIDELSNIVNF